MISHTDTHTQSYKGQFSHNFQTKNESTRTEKVTRERATLHTRLTSHPQWRQMTQKWHGIAHKACCSEAPRHHYYAQKWPCKHTSMQAHQLSVPSNSQRVRANTR
ncbi:hypothetical protein TRVL_06878 [Trypanosoma vivax]|nr:hypothetical protein TRVL_06878 [Trypanosoma vivax]